MSVLSLACSLAVCVLVVRAARRQTALQAKLVHELAMDAAVNVRGLKDAGDAVRLVRSSVDPDLSDALARWMGPGYERYLQSLHSRALAR